MVPIASVGGRGQARLVPMVDGRAGRRRRVGSAGAAVEQAPSVVDTSEDVPALDVQVRAPKAHQEMAPMTGGPALEGAPVGAGSTEASSPIFHFEVSWPTPPMKGLCRPWVGCVRVRRRLSGSACSVIDETPPGLCIPLLIFGGDAQNRTGDGGFADLCLTTWLRRRMLRANNLGRSTLDLKVPVGEHSAHYSL